MCGGWKVAKIHFFCIFAAVFRKLEPIMKKLCIWILLAFCLLMSGCQREIDMKLPDYQSKLVIEGTIETGSPAIVMLSKSIPYFSEINAGTLMNDVLVSGSEARVFVTSETGETEELLWQLNPEAPYYVAFMGNTVIGKEQTHYTLTVEYDGQTYTAETYIPKTFDLDSIGFDQSSDLLDDTMATIRVQLSDNPDEVNYYAFFTKVHSPKLTDRLWVCNLPVAFDDRTFNGLSFNYEISRYGYSILMRDMLSEEDRENFRRITFRPGDTVYVKHTQIDHDTYLYLLSAGSEAVFGSNPFTNPLPAVSNFNSDKVLGHWSGYAAKTDTLVWWYDEELRRKIQ